MEPLDSQARRRVIANLRRFAGSGIDHNNEKHIQAYIQVRQTFARPTPDQILAVINSSPPAEVSRGSDPAPEDPGEGPTQDSQTLSPQEMVDQMLSVINSSLPEEPSCGLGPAPEDPGDGSQRMCSRGGQEEG